MWHNNEYSQQKVPTGKHLHVLLHLLGSLLMDEIRQRRGDIQVLRTVLWTVPPFFRECWRPKQ